MGYPKKENRQRIVISSACCSLYFRNRNMIARSRFCSLYFVISDPKRLDFVTGFCTVKIDFPGFLIKVVIDRDRIGVAFYTVYGRNATAAFNQQMLCHLCADLVFLSPNRSEHRFLLLLMRSVRSF